MAAKAAILALALIGIFPGPTLEAQTATTGTLTGLVYGPNGAPVEGVEVTVTRPGEGWERVVAAGRSGHFTSGFLPPGEYELVVERLGYVPVHVQGITIRSGRQADVRITLRESPPPVTEVDRVAFGQVGRERAPAPARAVSRRDVRHVPTEGRELTGLLSRWSLAGPDHAVQGLPGRYTAVEVDGLRFDPVSHPTQGPGFLHLAALPTRFFEDLELAPHALDPEQGHAPGGTLRASTLRGSDRLEMEAFGSALGGPLGFADAAAGGDVASRFGPEAGALVRGPIRADTAHFAAGIQGRRAVRPVAPLAASSPLADGVFGLPGTDARAWDVVSGFGRLDWRPSAGRSFTLRTHLATARGDGGEAPGAPVLSPDGLEATDMILAGGFFGEIDRAGAVEVRVGAESSERTFGAGTGPGGIPLPASRIHEGGIALGAGPLATGTFRRSALRISPIVHYALGDHQLKGGVQLSVHRYRQQAGAVPGDAFLHPDPEAAQQERGLRLRSTGPSRELGFRRALLGLFVQNRWTPAEELAVTGGLRLDGELLPWDDILPSGAWEERTGFDRTADRFIKGRISPRLGVEWRPGGASGWLLRGTWGVRHGETDPAIMAEMLADTGAVRVRRTLGRTGAWPSGGGPSGISSEGAVLSVMAARFDAPRTRAAEAVVSRELARGTTLEVGVAQRRTDFLPRRRDLNRSPTRFAVDQFGREIYGEVVREEGVVAVVPGSDRRFTDFDVVWALESDGWSEWSGISVGVAHAAGPLEAEARYTRSEARDNVPGFAAGWPVAVRGRPTSGGGEPTWIEGRSDLDVPHRLAVSGSVHLLDSPSVRLGALWAFHSGTPFTPGVRDALDGTDPLQWAHAVPITVPSGLAAEMGELRAAWPCLTALEGASPRRNVCRTEGTHELNLRLGATLAGFGAWGIEVVVDGLNLLDSGRTIPDPAVFVVDGSREPGPVSGGEIELPVRVNPDFGQPLLRLSTGRSFRIAIGVRH